MLRYVGPQTHIKHIKPYPPQKKTSQKQNKKMKSHLFNWSLGLRTMQSSIRTLIKHVNPSLLPDIPYQYAHIGIVVAFLVVNISSFLNITS